MSFALGARRAAARCAVLASTLLLGCRQPIPPPAEPPPALDRPGAAIPADLDVALRIDLDAARRLFGPTVAHAFELNLVDAKEDPATAELVSTALSRASVVWVAFRPGLRTDTTDNVLILRGHFGELDPRGAPESDWGPPADLGAAFRRYDRVAPKRRSAPGRIYARADDWLVFVSSAELDSTERVIEERVADEHVDPPDRGMLSLAARVPSLVSVLTPSFPVAAQALEGAGALEASADADDRGLRATLQVRFDDDPGANQARDRARLLLGVLGRAEGPVGRLAKGATAEVVGPTMVVKIELDAQGLAGLVRCVGGEPCD